MKFVKKLHFKNYNSLNFFSFSNKGLSPVIAVILLLAVTVIVSMSMFNFTQNYFEDSQNRVSEETISSNQVVFASTDNVLVKTPYQDLNISRVFLEGVECLNNSGIQPSKLLDLDISSCSSSADKNSKIIVETTDNQVLKISTRDLKVSDSGSGNGMNHCSLGGLITPDGYSNYYYAKTKNNESQCLSLNRGCSNGILSGSNDYRYGSCNITYNMFLRSNLENIDVTFNDPTYSIKTVAGVGDVNGDSIEDFVIGLESNDEGGSNAGKVYLFFGDEDGWSFNQSLNSADASFIGESAGDNSGRSVSKAGDVNNDGYDDILIVGSSNIHVIFGKSSGWIQNQSLTTANASFLKESGGSTLSIDGGGDVNNDGFDDILIGDRGNDERGSSAGQVYLILGKSSGWSMDQSLSAVDASFRPISADYYLGSDVSFAGDVNGDGYDDILMGANQQNDDVGIAYVIFGKSSGWSMDQNLWTDANASFRGEIYNDRLGEKVSKAGDVNGDGYDDFLIGAPYNDAGGGNSGQTYLILGKSTGWV